MLKRPIRKEFLVGLFIVNELVLPLVRCKINIIE